MACTVGVHLPADTRSGGLMMTGSKRTLNNTVLKACLEGSGFHSNFTFFSVHFYIGFFR